MSVQIENAYAEQNGKSITEPQESADEADEHESEDHNSALTAEQDTSAAEKCGSAATTEQSSAGPVLSAAQRARMERQRLRARALQDARLVRRPKTGECEARVESRTEIDSGGGFLLPVAAAAAEPPRLSAPPAPLVHATEQPRCMDCGRSFPQSFLYDNFDYSVCDDCRDDEDAHSLITRTEAKSEFLLKDCDLDLRPPPLRCVRRRNPHSSRGDMRLYLRPQVEKRAREAWGGEEALRVERETREAARETSRRRKDARRLRALRMDVRSSLYDRAHAQHEHDYGPERHDPDADVYERTCSGCGHVQTYEKM